MGRPAHDPAFAFATGLLFGVILLAATLAFVPQTAISSPAAELPNLGPGGPLRGSLFDGTFVPKPTMGWNSWNRFACNIDETLARGIADGMVAGGPNSLLAAGYDVLTLDDCWSVPYRDAAGDLANNPTTFPS